MREGSCFGHLEHADALCRAQESAWCRSRCNLTDSIVWPPRPPWRGRIHVRRRRPSPIATYFPTVVILPMTLAPVRSHSRATLRPMSSPRSPLRDRFFAIAERAVPNDRRTVVEKATPTAARPRDRRDRGHHQFQRSDQGGPPGGWWIAPRSKWSSRTMSSFDPTSADGGASGARPVNWDPVKLRPDWVCEIVSASNAGRHGAEAADLPSAPGAALLAPRPARRDAHRPALERGRVHQSLAGGGVGTGQPFDAIGSRERALRRRVNQAGCPRVAPTCVRS